MIEQIDELDNKYLVLKWDDINNNFSQERKQQLDEMIGLITYARAAKGKLPQSYVVLNRSDNINLGGLMHDIHNIIDTPQRAHTQKICDFGIDFLLINAVLRGNEYPEQRWSNKK